MKLTILNPKDPTQDFPPVSRALLEPEGLLAIGGCLSSERLLKAYQHGAFPWYNAGEPILWWSPDPRSVIFPEQLRVSHSLAKTLRKQCFSVTFDRCFDDVVNACSKSRKDQQGSWITPDIKRAYGRLHRLGAAHSVEAWQNETLVGGLYGVAIGQVFFGESMFHHQTDASKVAFVTLVERLKSCGYRLIDCQVHSKHLASLGAEMIPRPEFIRLLRQYCDAQPLASAWIE